MSSLPPQSAKGAGLISLPGLTDVMTASYQSMLPGLLFYTIMGAKSTRKWMRSMIPDNKL